MYYDSNPPFAKTKNEFPSMNYVVTVANCWYYLSLLERFVDTTQEMTEDILKLYLVRAEYRYFRWISQKSPNRDISLSIPPIDVAFFWQAHMLSPRRYYEDTLRMPPFSETHIPLKEIHDMKKNPNAAVLHEWKIYMKGEPYTLTEETLLNESSTATVTCVVCFARIESPWKEYTEWRTDHTVALQCHNCFTMFTVKHVGKANLFADNHQKKQLTAGLILDYRGNFIKATEEHEHLKPLQETKALPFNQGLKPLENYIKKHQAYPPTEIGVKRRKKIIGAIQSTYLSTPYRGSSIDLIQAVARQFKFAFRATKVINWDAPQGIIKGIRHYGSFLVLIKENPLLVAVPTFEIDLAWHTHMLYPSNYRTFTMEFVGKLVNHDDNIPEAKLDLHVQKTDQAWKVRSQKRREATMTLPPYVGQQPVIISSSPSEKTTTGIKSKLKSIFSSFDANNVGAPRVARVADTRVVVDPRKNGYISEEKIFNRGRYNPGTFKTSPPYVPDVASGEERSQDNIDYDKKKISFHDKREIKEFITLNNSDELMDRELADVKNSVYGFIGTSNCANTDYLDQWDTSDVGDALKSLQNKGGIHKYTKVFLTVGKKPAVSSKSLSKLPTSMLREYMSFQGSQARMIQYNSTGDAFNWYAVSLAWGGVAAATKNKSRSSDFSAPAGCGGDASWGSTDIISSCGAGTSSCGTGTSSCGGGSSAF